MNICKIQDLVNNEGIVFLSYSGYMSQILITAMVEALEKEAEDNCLTMKASHTIFTIFIELSQNIMSYSKNIEEDNDSNKPEGLIIITKDEDYKYYIHSQNIISLDDKDKIEIILQEIQSLDKDGIKQRYKELRRSGANTHQNGGGIGFYEIAKKCDDLEYTFTKVNKNKYYFYVKTTIITKKGEM